MVHSAAPGGRVANEGTVFGGSVVHPSAILCVAVGGEDAVGNHGRG